MITAVFLGLMLLASILDIRFRRIGDAVILFGFAVAILAHRQLGVRIALWGFAAGYGAVLLAGMVAMGILWACGFHRRWSMGDLVGGGDVKLAAMMGAFLGVQGVAVALGVAALVAMAALVPAALAGVREAPLAPCMAVGGAVAVWWADPLAGLVLRML